MCGHLTKVRYEKLYRAIYLIRSIRVTNIKVHNGKHPDSIMLKSGTSDDELCQSLKSPFGNWQADAVAEEGR